MFQYNMLSNHYLNCDGLVELLLCICVPLLVEVLPFLLPFLRSCACLGERSRLSLIYLIFSCISSSSSCSLVPSLYLFWFWELFAMLPLLEGSICPFHVISVSLGDVFLVIELTSSSSLSLSLFLLACHCFAFFRFWRVKKTIFWLFKPFQNCEQNFETI